ncbi:alpha/beta fold hydrolase [Flavobacterium gawalongense]|uniref:Alpha/beta hydrolase n=1 Tax=Flavobacterium gawalongense TaxID=2594432 RepID=A0A553BBV4_9FLAO|nr:alpha/beta hydrolase [Flavobacterium gawalongense]TRW98050.1 alpha/beta hydrolase [Flavobacterium gawalongense]TRX02521.1 alpha/beta hydrolase [Flavobacterium gawalongense]TRX05734.1 alpha/beta hydrolase [Flavobacterium gawalongense]TRX06653.1 alpha/beta hydrolase [Flavobacterium gawalongense]TRX22392.1 alpha/beta hydrolase [Flavobacterium gawalongense]
METNQINRSESLSGDHFSGSKIGLDKYIETAPGVKLYVKDYGEGKPVILIHGWPLSNEMWEYQIDALVQNNFRVITYDRRGFGKSSQPWNGYDYDTLSDDLKTIIDHLDLKEATLVGFSMGGGEVVRYFSRHGGKGVSKAVLIASVTPFQLKTDSNPDGVPQEKYDGMAEQIKEDRIGFLDSFGKTFFGVSFISKPISTPLLDYYRMLCSFASPRATLECAKSFSSTDFRKEMASVNVPTLIIHGDEDKTVPIEITSEIATKLIPDNKFIVYEGAPHGLFYIEKDKLNKDLIEFLNS